MSHLDQDDRDFDAYLQNDHALSDLYRELPQEHPSAELDRRVLEHVGETKTGSRLRRWTPYFGIAATALLAIGLARLMPPAQQVLPTASEPGRSESAQAPAPAPPAPQTAAPAPRTQEHNETDSVPKALQHLNAKAPASTYRADPDRAAVGSMQALESIGQSSASGQLFNRQDTSSETPDELARIRALLASNKTAEARTALLQWRDSHPHRSVPPDLRALLETPIIPAKPAG